MSEENLTILTVDDEAVIRDLLHSFLIKKGYNSIVASNGKEALRFVNEKLPDVVLLDIKMPEMDGHQICQSLRKVSSSSKPIGIIMITGYGSLNNKEKAVECGADDLMEKPLDLYELMYRIKVWQEVRKIKDQMERITRYAYKIRQYNKEKKTNG
jgi:DNA-binding response OmpR family regulator